MKNIIIIIIAVLATSIAVFAQPPCDNVVHIADKINIKLTDQVIVHPPGPPVPPPLGPNDERIVYWVHGLGGNSEAWAKAADASSNSQHNVVGFQARKLQSKKVAYGEYSSLIGASQELRDDINEAVDNQNTENVDPNNNFIIAHSQGGMISSALLYNDFEAQPMPESERYYGGLVTVSSPLQGALIVNNTPRLLEMSGEACHALAAGPTSTIAFTLIDFFTDVEVIVEDFCDFIEEGLMPKIFEPNTVPTTNGFRVGSEEIQMFNNAPTPGIDRVAFYGVEPPENLLWRTMEHFVKNPNSSQYWGANLDHGKLWEKVVENKLKYEDKVLEMTFKIAVLELDGYPCDDPLSWLHNNIGCLKNNLIYNNAVEQKAAWQLGVNWFNNINDEYLFAIGAKQVQTMATSIVCNCLDTNVEPPVNITYDGPCQGSGTLCEENTQTYNMIVQRESDGVVLAESASNSLVSGDQNRLTAPPVRLENSSHMQVRNNSAIRDALTNLYDGEYGLFFATPPR